MAIYRRLGGLTLSFDDKTRMGIAYELLLTKLRLSDRDDPVTELIATRIMEAFEAGEKEPPAICAHVMARLGIDNPEPDSPAEKRGRQVS
jgi:hypothetical protein